MHDVQAQVHKQSIAAKFAGIFIGSEQVAIVAKLIAVEPGNHTPDLNIVRLLDASGLYLKTADGLYLAAQNV